MGCSAAILAAPSARLLRRKRPGLPPCRHLPERSQLFRRRSVQLKAILCQFNSKHANRPLGLRLLAGGLPLTPPWHNSDAVGRGLLLIVSTGSRPQRRLVAAKKFARASNRDYTLITTVQAQLRSSLVQCRTARSGQTCAKRPRSMRFEEAGSLSWKLHCAADVQASEYEPGNPDSGIRKPGNQQYEGGGRSSPCLATGKPPVAGGFPNKQDLGGKS